VYEWLFSNLIEDYCYRHPEISDYPAMLERIRSWRERYVQYGRDHLDLVFTFLGPINLYYSQIFSCLLTLKDYTKQ
jgi:hypothetical protein